MNYIFEGRREDILKKYMADFDISVLDAVLNDPFIKSSNYKYADWILKKLEFNSLPLAMEVLELVKQFDRVGKNLEIKDINQYPDVVELKAAIEDYGSKSQRKKIESEAEKIYEDNRILIVKPTSHAASCKYGMGTKWCTTQSSPGYFEKYSTGDNVLYYLIMKDFDISNKFYKIALHKTPREETWYDAQDTVMPPREVDILKVGLGKTANQKIEEDFSKHTTKNLYKLFDSNNSYHVIVTKNLLSSKKPLTFDFSNPRIIDKDMAEIDFKIFFGWEEDEQKIEEGTLMISYHLSDSMLDSDIGYQPNDDFEPPVEIENLWRINIAVANFPISSPGDMGSPFNSYCNRISGKIWGLIQNDQNLKNFVLGDKKAWYPNRMSYGFTFEKKDGLINKLVDYIDSGKEGNAIDFLIDIGKITKRKLNDGSFEYIGKNGPIYPKGYFSSFFASATRAGILSYERKNKKNILTKGPNFDDFKKGNLKAL